MSKKTKRQTTRKTTTVVTAPAPAPSISANGKSRSTYGEFNPDYTPVIKDLKRIAILAGSFFVVLILLSFFLR